MIANPESNPSPTPVSVSTAIGHNLYRLTGFALVLCLLTTALILFAPLGILVFPLAGALFFLLAPVSAILMVLVLFMGIPLRQKLSLLAATLLTAGIIYTAFIVTAH